MLQRLIWGRSLDKWSLSCILQSLDCTNYYIVLACSLFLSLPYSNLYSWYPFCVLEVPHLLWFGVIISTVFSCLPRELEQELQYSSESDINVKLCHHKNCILWPPPECWWSLVVCHNIYFQWEVMELINHSSVYFCKNRLCTIRAYSIDLAIIAIFKDLYILIS